ncbi:MAG: type II toxin-antitoxin system VapC family toxin [Niabella sp.]
MGKNVLIDTNVLLGYIGKALPAKGMTSVAKLIDEAFNISFVNKIEILGHPSADEELKAFIDLAAVFDLSDAIVEKTIQIRKQHKTKLGDALIAATALVEGLTLVTRNEDDFKKIEGIEIINPWKM